MSDNSSIKLSISSHVVVQLGRELVTDDEQALLELVKNAYDADSPSCTITIEPDWMVSPEDKNMYFSLFPDLIIDEKNDSKDEIAEKQKNTKPKSVGRILVKDVGIGISSENIESRWLRISASNKRVKNGEVKEKTALGRTPVGDKGLGRLATMKLGKIILLHTTKKHEKNTRCVWFSWADFTEDRTLEDVPVYNLEPKTKDTPKNQGSTIEIIGLHDMDSWHSTNRISKGLSQKLSDLVSPFLEKAGFEILIKHSGSTYNISTLNEEALNLSASSWIWKWNGKQLIHKANINELTFFGTGRGQGLFDYKKVFECTNMREKFIKSIKNSRKFKNYGVVSCDSPDFITINYTDEIGDILPVDKNYPDAEDPGPFEAHIYDFNYSNKAQEALSVAGVSKDRLKNSGVLIFRDGFRIRTDQDWINFAGSQTSGGSYYGFRPDNTIGYTLISNEYNAKLIEKSDRESFVDNPAYRGFMLLITRLKKQDNDFRTLLRRHFLEFLKSNAVPNDSRPSTKKYLSDLQDNSINISKSFSGVIGDLNQLDEVIDDKNFDVKKAKLLAARLSSKTKALAEKNMADVEKLNFISKDAESNEVQYLRLIDAAAVGLTARSISHELHEYSRQFKQGIDGLHKENKTLKNANISKNLKLLRSTERELSKMISALDPLLPGTRTIKEKINLHSFINDYVSSRNSRAASKGVEISFVSKGNSEFNIRFNHSRLLQVLENLFQNSMYWLTHFKKLKLSKPLEIVIELNDSDICWYDSGPGVNQIYEETLFDPYISDKPLTEGQGLGLHIISVFLRSERCSIILDQERNTLKRRYKFLIDMLPAKFISKQRKIL